MAAESYSTWFLRFLAAFKGPASAREAGSASHEEWLTAFVDSFRGEGAAAAEWTLSDDASEERDWNLTNTEPSAETESLRQTPRAEDKQRYMQSGGEDVEQ